MADDFVPGLEGVIAFETTIAEPDKDGGALRYRGVDIEDLVGKITFGNVWALLVDGKFGPGLPPAEPFPIPVHTGDVRVDVQAALAMLTPIWGYRPLLDISAEEAREELARAAVMALSYVAQSARGIGTPAVPQKRVDEASTIVERFMIRWRGEPDPAHVAAVDAYWTSAAEHGMNASTFTARVIASTGADVAASLSGAIGAMSGPLHGGAPSRVLHMLDDVEKAGDAEKYVKDLLDRKERLMGFGHRVYRAEDPRARVLRQAAEELGAPALRGRAGPGAGRAQGAARAAPRPAGRDQRRVLGGDRPRLRRGAQPHVHLDVHLRPHRRLVRAHPRAEGDRPARAPVGPLHRAGARASPRRSRAGTPSRSSRPRGRAGLAVRSTDGRFAAAAPAVASAPSAREDRPDEHLRSPPTCCPPTAGSAAGRRRSARRRCTRSPPTAPRSWAPRTGRRR